MLLSSTILQVILILKHSNPIRMDKGNRRHLKRKKKSNKISVPMEINKNITKFNRSIAANFSARESLYCFEDHVHSLLEICMLLL